MVDFSDDLKSQWHPSLNLPLTMETYTAPSKKVWWLGKCGHSWQSSYFDRSRGYGCSYCSGKKILIGFNDFQSQNPEIAKEWHPTKNDDLLPTQIFAKTSIKKVWWQCSLGHEWDAKPLHRANGSGCPVCTNRTVLKGFNDISTTHPNLAKEWHPTKNIHKPNEVSIGTKNKIWWLGECGHEWESIPYDRYAKQLGCVYCSGFKTLKGFNDIATTHPHLVGEWHPTKNGNLSPQDVSAGSAKQSWWKCSLGHEWKAVVATRGSGGSGCPYCSGNVVMSGFNDLATLNPALALEWHPTRNTLLPTQVTQSSGLKAWWIGLCGHEWEAVIANRTNGAGCNICGYIQGGVKNSTPVLGQTDLASQFPEITKEWSAKNYPLLPTMVRSGTKRRVWWVCAKGHEWETPVSYRTGADKTCCPVCALNIYVSRQETELKQFLESLGIKVEQSNRKILNGKEIDLFLPEVNVGIEFNGVYWHSEMHKDKNYHYDKWVAAQNAGIQLIQIWEDDYRDRKGIVLKSLAHKIKRVKEFTTLYPEYEDSFKAVGARKTKVVVVSTPQSKEFLEANHIQGFASGSVYLGLVDRDDVLRALLVLKREKNNTLNIIRYATFGLVQGGFTKLLKHATVAYKPDAFITFADHSISDGKLYEAHGFIVDRMIPPDYMYLVDASRRHKFGYRLKRFRDDPLLVWHDGLTERELALLNKLPRIWDSGKTRYRLDVLS